MKTSLQELDIIFISSFESNSEENWQSLRGRFPRAQRVHGVVGIDNAHKEAAKLARTDFFYVVDGDNHVLPCFHFERPDWPLDEQAVYVWRCLNPVNKLVYGYGAIKLYNKQLLASYQNGKFRDFATSLTTKYVVVDELASETHYNVSPEEAWRGAFRESVKLTWQIQKEPSDIRSRARLDVWRGAGIEEKNGEWALNGANMGFKFAYQNQECPENRGKINNFSILKEMFSNSKDFL